jgi:hypothetical protein
VSGERDLARLLAGMRPALRPGVYLFATVREPDPDLLAASLATFREVEGTTVVLEEAEAERRSVLGSFRSAWITLEIHSDLAAVGFLARVAAELASAGIPCNAISAFHHDHLFVPVADGERAVVALERLARSATV